MCESLCVCVRRCVRVCVCAVSRFGPALRCLRQERPVLFLGLVTTRVTLRTCTHAPARAHAWEADLPLPLRACVCWYGCVCVHVHMRGHAFGFVCARVCLCVCGHARHLCVLFDVSLCLFGFLCVRACVRACECAWAEQ
jgi:hypothetical protein